MLSNTPRETLDTYTALLEIAGFVKNNSNLDIEGTVKKIYSLTEKESSQAEEARANIKEYQDLLLSNKKLMADLQEEQDNSDKRVSEIKAALEVIDGKNKALDKRKKELDAISVEQAKKEKDLSEQKIIIDNSRIKLTGDQVAFEEAKTLFAEEQATAKRKAEEIRRLSEGL